MYQESRGEGGDPMQASESAGLPPNTIIRTAMGTFHILCFKWGPTPPPSSLRLRRTSKGIRSRELQNFNLMTIEFSPSIHEI